MHKLPYICRDCGVVFDHCADDNKPPTDCHHCRTTGTIVVREAWQRYQTMLAEQYERHLLRDRATELAKIPCKRKRGRPRKQVVA